MARLIHVKFPKLAPTLPGSLRLQSARRLGRWTAAALLEQGRVVEYHRRNIVLRPERLGGPVRDFMSFPSRAAASPWAR